MKTKIAMLLNGIIPDKRIKSKQIQNTIGPSHSQRFPRYQAACNSNFRLKKIPLSIFRVQGHMAGKPSQEKCAPQFVQTISNIYSESW